MPKEEETKILEELTKKIDELTIKVNKMNGEENTTINPTIISEKSKETLKVLTEKIKQMTLAIKENKICTENKIKENPWAYVAGAFTGGLILGLLAGNRKE